ncbi:MAG: IPT/TIG domain-containing protein [Candidatus Saccharimonadales bacterium]
MVHGLHAQGEKLSIQNKFKDPAVLAFSAFLACLILSFVASSMILQPQKSNAVTGLGLVDDPTMNLTASSSEVNMEITPTNTGTLISGSHTLTADTNMPSGYNLNLATVIPSTLSTSTGTIASPTPLSNNTWGFATTQVSSSSAANTITNGFDASYAVPTPSATSKWANPTPTTTIKNTTQSTTGGSTTIYYGAKIDTNQTAGTYSNLVRYTATPNTTSLPSLSIISITPSSGPTTGGTAITIVGTGFTYNDQSVTRYVTIGGVACGNVSISSNTPIAGRDTIYCNAPANTAGTKGVTVQAWNSGATNNVPGYTYIAPATVSFVSPNYASIIPGTESGQAFSIVGSGFTGATTVTIGGESCESFTVISDTQIACTGPRTITTTGANSVVVTKTNVDSNSTVIVDYTDNGFATLQGSDAFSQCTTTAKLFRDTRDSQLYYAKKMADGKCWIVDNLEYAGYGTLSQTAGSYLTQDGTNTITPYNYHVAKYVDPGAHSYCSGSVNIPSANSTRCGFLYNWYTATAGTGTLDLGTGQQASASICPANWRLPSSYSDVDDPTAGGLYWDSADFPVLNASMNAGATTTGNNNNYYQGWQPTGAWNGMYSGGWSNNFNIYGNGGIYISSTADGTNNMATAYYSTSSINVTSIYNKSYAFAVRCVMEAPEAENGDLLQEITSDTCPVTNKIWAVDARDNRTYWVQKLADGKCWMLTNLAYAGGGTNTYGDTKTIANSNPLSYTNALYMIPTSANPTTSPTTPSTSTDGGATNTQYGYLYNWCAAMGAQTSTSACTSSTTPTPNQSISICPSGWRLPTAGSGGEYQALNNAINSGSSTSPTGLLTT